MELRPGYKQTEVGLIPAEWGTPALEQHCSKLNVGFVGVCEPYYTSENNGVMLIRTGNLYDQKFNFEDLKYVTHNFHKVNKNSQTKKGDILIARHGSSGSAVLVPSCVEEANTLNIVIIRTIADELDNLFAQYAINSGGVKRQVLEVRAGSTQGVINTGDIAKLIIPRPSIIEQRAIAETLSDADSLIESLEQLIAKKRHLKQGAMQELLTGKKRLPGFGGAWEVKRITEIATPSSEKNIAAEALPVLTCSKYLGFVDSLGFFKNQVFSKDTSTYKIIRRGQIGYPANHIEEGSIGLQNLYQEALVSPIYIVFSVNEGVDSFFLHRVLKLDSYRNKFKTATTSSVDRRGSLRWPAFSEITVNIPPLPEQTAIVTILSDMDAEISALETKLAKARSLKQGMMHNLLTGRIRLV